MVVLFPPPETPVASPPLLPVATMVATVVSLEVHIAWVVTSVFEPSSSVAMALNCFVVWPRENWRVKLEGLTVIVVTVWLLTVNVVLALTLPDLAVTVVVPIATPVANPPALMVAMPVFDEVHVTLSVASPMVLLPKVAVAENCCVACGLTNGPVGETDSAVMVLEDGKKPLQETSETSINATTPRVA